MTVRICLLAFCITAVFALSVLGIKDGNARSFHTGVAPDQSPVGSNPKTAEQQFKNIQVLKGIPADDLIPTMQFITASLGVECEFCHVEKAFEKDDKKPKQTARKMMEMMFAINNDNFNGNREVTCNSCHRGKAHPQAVPAVMSEDAWPGSGPSPGAEKKDEKGENNSIPSPDQLLDKYVEALGGDSAINQVSTRVMRGTMSFSGQSVPIEIYCKAPDARISFAHMKAGDSVTAFNGHEGWLAMTGGPSREMRGSDLDGASIDADLHLATHLKEMFTEIRVRGTEKIDDHNTYEVIGRRETKPPIRLYFDQQSGLLVRLIRYGDTALGLLPTQIDYADYRNIQGVKVAYRWTSARPSGRFTVQVGEMQQNVPVDDAKFVKPAPTRGK